MRTITSTELEFLRTVEALSGMDLTTLGLTDQSLVEPMNDGGMGSLYFPTPKRAQSNRRLGKQIVVGLFNDLDDVPISFTVNVDQDGLLYEIDIWRTDSQPLQSLPSARNEIRIISQVS